MRRLHAQAGESAAAEHLIAAGYTLIHRNLRVGHDEADIVAFAPSGSLVIVEVKARAGDWNGEDRIDANKRRNLLRLAASLATEPRFRRRLLQFDVVAVRMRADAVPLEVRHFPHAFDASGTGW
jgi:putative endonuclease